MIPRYTLPEMGAIWTDTARFEQMLRVEIEVGRHVWDPTQSSPSLATGLPPPTPHGPALRRNGAVRSGEPRETQLRHGRPDFAAVLTGRLIRSPSNP